ncbi:hypothetical protein T484DRAFT_2027083 [Baffinella frigidus]|nr:hypothetical protein T484DRAFT_2027083 [Cryptophyta sp. CCMP2293]
MDVVVGIAGFPHEWPRLRHWENIVNGVAVAYTSNNTLDSDSIESGLITVVLHGNETFFEQPHSVEKGFSLEIEDAITIHFMEPAHTQPHFEAMYGMVKAGLAFDVAIHIAEQRAYLVPTYAMINLCPYTMVAPSPTTGTCVSRRDIFQRTYPAVSGAYPTAMEINVTDGTDDESEFMERILSESEYAGNLGANYSQIISDKFNLNGRYRRAWWINPGYVWNQEQIKIQGTNRLTLSQRIMLIILVGFDEQDGTRRRTMLSVIKDADGQTSAAVASSFTYKLQPSDVVAGALGVLPERVSTWEVVMRLKPGQVCMKPYMLKTIVHDSLIGHLAATCSPLLSAQIISFDIDKGSESCRRRRLLAESDPEYSTASAKIMVALVFSDTSDMTINLLKLRSMPDIITVEALGVFKGTVTIDNAYVPPSQLKEAPAEAQPEESTARNTTVIIGILCATLLGLAAAMFAVVIRARRLQRKAPSLQGGSSADLVHPMQLPANNAQSVDVGPPMQRYDMADFQEE